MSLYLANTSDCSAIRHSGGPHGYLSSSHFEACAPFADSFIALGEHARGLTGNGDSGSGRPAWCEHWDGSDTWRLLPAGAEKPVALAMLYDAPPDELLWPMPKARMSSASGGRVPPSMRTAARS